MVFCITLFGLLRWGATSSPLSWVTLTPTSPKRGSSQLGAGGLRFNLLGLLTSLISTWDISLILVAITSHTGTQHTKGTLPCHASTDASAISKQQTCWTGAHIHKHFTTSHERATALTTHQYFSHFHHNYTNTNTALHHLSPIGFVFTRLSFAIASCWCRSSLPVMRATLTPSTTLRSSLR